MITTFEVKPNELDDSFLAVLQSIMKGRSSRIIVEPLFDENEELEMDETEFLLSNTANKAMLFNAKEQLVNGNKIELSWDDHHKMLEDVKQRVANGE